jgi:hypothetical protein
MSTSGFFHRAQLPTVPTSKQFTGEYSFEISFGPPTESAPKSATWTYSTKTSKLYTNIGSYCPFQFKTNGKSINPAFIRAVAMFKGSSNLHDIVKMCANHAENNNEGEFTWHRKIENDLLSSQYCMYSLGFSLSGN